MANGMLPPGTVVSPRTANGQVRGENGHLYSAYLLPTSLAKGEDALFLNNVHGVGQGSSNALTYVETNMENAGRVSDSRSWVITDFGVGCNTSVALADLKKILDNSFVVFQKPGYVRYFGPSFFFGAGGGITGATTENNVGSYTNGMASPRLVRRPLGKPIILNKGTSFSCSVFVGNAGYSTQTLSATTRFWIDLWGSFLESIPQ